MRRSVSARITALLRRRTVRSFLRTGSWRVATPPTWKDTDVERGVSITLPAELRSVSHARRFVAGTADAWIDDLAEVLLMTSELVTNVVRHAKSDVTVTVRRGPPVRVEVRDFTAATDALRELLTGRHWMPDASSPSGRGLAIVRSLAGRIGLDDDTDGGKVVWFEIAEAISKTAD